MVSKTTNIFGFRSASTPISMTKTKAKTKNKTNTKTVVSKTAKYLQLQKGTAPTPISMTKTKTKTKNVFSKTAK